MEMLEYYTENMFGLLESPVRAKLPCLFKNDKYAVLYAPKTRDGCSSIIMVRFQGGHWTDINEDSYVNLGTVEDLGCYISPEIKKLVKAWDKVKVKYAENAKKVKFKRSPSLRNTKVKFKRSPSLRNTKN